MKPDPINLAMARSVALLLTKPGKLPKRISACVAPLAKLKPEAFDNLAARRKFLALRDLVTVAEQSRDPYQCMRVTTALLDLVWWLALRDQAVKLAAQVEKDYETGTDTDTEGSKWLM